jgi:hypothetical protein
MLVNLKIFNYKMNNLPCDLKHMLVFNKFATPKFRFD